jgi:hypothetical protein
VYIAQPASVAKRALDRTPVQVANTVIDNLDHFCVPFRANRLPDHISGVDQDPTRYQKFGYPLNIDVDIPSRV